MCGWHSDSHPQLGRNPPVASVSLGAVRVFELRKKKVKIPAGCCAWFRIRIRIGSGFNQASGSGSVFGIRIRIQEGKNDPQLGCNPPVASVRVFELRKKKVKSLPAVAHDFGSGSVLDPDSIRLVGPDPYSEIPDPDPGGQK
jgi:hypothetical protein